MKKIYLYTLLALLSVNTSCTEILNTEPEITISDQAVIVDRKSAQAALIGVYDGLQGYASTNILALDLAADNVVSYNNQNVLVRDQTAAGGAGGFSAIYATINRANFVLNKVPALGKEAITEADRNQLLGEAYFLRALSYFDLAKTYGGVQLVLEPAVSPNTHAGIKRSTRQETYAQVLADLNKAEELLKETVNRNRATKFSVYALKARLYLYTEQWDLAEQYADKTISNSNFKLVKPYSVFFTGRNTEESILELAYSTSDKSSFYTNWLSPAEGGRHDYIPAREFVGLLLDPNLGGSRKSLIKQTAEGSWDLIQYGKQDGTSSIFLLRLAEQYLIRAEARARKTNPDLAGAVQDLNAIKSRADVPLYTYAPTTTPDEILLAIENERRFELPFEGHRFLDIVRTGRAPAVFAPINARLTNSQFWVFPIPASEIQTDPDLSQNPGY